MGTQAAASQGTYETSDARSPTVKIPMMTKVGRDSYGDTTLQNLQSGLYVNVEVLGFGDANGTTAPIGGGADLQATDLSKQRPATEGDSDAAVEPVTIDTGSWATVLSQDFVAKSLAKAGVTLPTDLGSSGYPSGTLTYSSNKQKTETGHWVPITIGFPDASNPDGSMVTTTVTALITDTPGNHAMMGVAMDAAFSIPTTSGGADLQVTPDSNAFLSVAQMRAGKMAHSFAIRNDGIYLGENAADARAEGDWTLQKLDPSTIGRSPNGVQDWRFPLADVSVGGKTYEDVSMMNDTGILNMYLETEDGKIGTKNRTVSFTLDGECGPTRWSYTSPGSGGDTVTAKTSDDDQLLAPSKLDTNVPNHPTKEHPEGAWTDVAKANVGSDPGNPNVPLRYTNTGVNVLCGFDYLYDADRGVFGLSSTDRNLPATAASPGDDTAPSAAPTPDQAQLTAPMGATLAGGPGDDTIVGAGSNLLLGRQGDDLITAGSGANTVFGGIGNDMLSAGDGSNLLYGGEGADTITAGDGGDTIVGGTGDAASDSLDGADLIRSGSGSDLILGNGGDDTVGAGAGDDTVAGGFGKDVLLGNQGDDFILGNQGDDTLVGGFGADTLVGGQGNDVLYGSQGDDVLYGNEGLNTFVFNPGDTDLGSGAGDTVMDFVSGKDRLDFASGPAGSASDFGAASTTVKDFASIQALAQTLIAGGDSYAFVADGTDGYLFATGGTGTTIADAVKLTGAGTQTSLRYQDIAHGPLA